MSSENHRSGPDSRGEHNRDLGAAPVRPVGHTAAESSRILVADDHDLVRETMAEFIARDPCLETRDARNLDETLALIAAEGPFDLVLLDYQMPGMDGLLGLSRAAAANGGRPVALMSGSASRAVAHEALARGAAGFLPKSLPSRSLLNAVRFMLVGERFLPEWFLDETPEPTAAAPSIRLTEREQKVLAALSRGLSDRQISHELNLHELTVKFHVKSLCRKLGANDRQHAISIAAEHSLV